MNTTASRRLLVLAPVLTGLLLLALWELSIVLGDISVLLLPAPHVIAAEVVENFSYLLSLSAATARDAFVGTLTALVIAILAAWLVHGSARLSQVLGSLSTAIKALPVIALFPIATIFLGNGPAAVIAIVCVTGIPIAFVYALRGLQRASDLDEVMRVVAAGPIRRFWSMRLPLAMPYLLTGLNTVLPLAVITAIIAEYFGGPISTLGTYIRRESATLHTVPMWSAIVMACLLGLLAAGIGALAVRAARRLEGTTGTP